jgi:hypothetical protein
MNFSQIEPKYVVLAVVVVLALIMMAVIYARDRARMRTQLRERFGPEYNRAVEAEGSARRAEAQLADRARRVEKFRIRDLAPSERDRFTNQWNALQLRFVDSPRAAVAEADDLIQTVMHTRGYPVSDFEQRAADISVDHPIVVENYRAANGIANRLRSGSAATEDLRTTMIHYRALFEELVSGSPTAEVDRRRDVA